jgi:signal recognition particle subunit SEC65
MPSPATKSGQKKTSKKKKRGFSLNDQANSYYGPSSGTSTETTHPSFTKQHSAGLESYTSDELADNKDFIALRKMSSSKKKKKTQRKDSGFNQTDDALSQRAERFSGPGGIDDATLSNSKHAVAGFDRYMGKTTIGGSRVTLDEKDYERMTVKGTCMELEKAYLRLTAPPRPELVRPQPVLQQHLRNLKKERKSAGRRDYLWFCSQLKAIRQDCTVQRIQNAFAVDVYETHARIALEEDDLNEYNQCQTQLKELYHLLEDKQPAALRNRNEFLALRVIYYVFLTGSPKYDGGSSDLFKIMLSLTPEQVVSSHIAYALAVREAVSFDDYHAFFSLRRRCPSQGALHLINRIVSRMRHQALLRVCKVYRPSVEVEFVLRELGFEVEKEEDLESGRKWLESSGCVISEDGQEVLTKDSVVRESDMEEKRSLI